jgi:hypothetical protein
VFQYPISAGPSLAPHKLAVVSVFTAEMLAASNIDSFTRSLLSESAALAFDAALFGSQADNGVTPPGLLAGVSASTPASGTDKRENMLADLGTLVQDIASRGGGGDPAFVMAPAQAVFAKGYLGPHFDAPVLASMVLPAGTAICIEQRSVVATIAAVTPEFSTAESTLLMMDDSAPTDVVAGSPTRSLFQIDSTALKMTLRGIDWKMRAPHVALIDAVNW